MDNYNRIGFWLKGYIDAIQDAESVTKEQLENLIMKLKQLIEENENNYGDRAVKINKEEYEEVEDDDDLPF